MGEWIWVAPFPEWLSSSDGQAVLSETPFARILSKLHIESAGESFAATRPFEPALFPATLEAILLSASG